MRKIEASTLEEAYIEATQVFNASINQLDIEVIQRPFKGLLGLMKKNAIILVDLKNNININKNKAPQEHHITDNIGEVAKNMKDKIETIPKKIVNSVSKKAENLSDNIQKIKPDIHKHSKMFDNFFADKKSDEDIILEIEKEIKHLIKLLCFDLDIVKVIFFDKTTIEVFIDGKDSALMIGKEGYRYKALSYLLLSWINPKYGYQVRLEIAEFYKKQTEMVLKYLETIYSDIEKDKKVETKILDGILLQIALNHLRDRYNNKYVAVRSNDDGSKYVLINSFYQKKQYNNNE